MLGLITWAEGENMTKYDKKSECSLSTHPLLLALQQVEGTGPLNAGQEPDGVRPDQPLQQADVARRVHDVPAAS